ncbi:hypothetical protein [Prevotella sp. KH2C16]|uniref:hypothetical protein n=1 Tax=Prevotella sp. KH2C16 TaxID=1855325 RepID=UPI0015A66203|nr:hypothetical protein [Prevotella sp. KH2C16]
MRRRGGKNVYNRRGRPWEEGDGRLRGGAVAVVRYFQGGSVPPAFLHGSPLEQEPCPADAGRLPWTAHVAGGQDAIRFVAASRCPFDKIGDFVR